VNGRRRGQRDIVSSAEMISRIFILEIKERRKRR